MRNAKGQFVKGYTYVPTVEHRRRQSLAKLGKKRPAWVGKKISEGKKGKLLGKNAPNWRGGRIGAGNGYFQVYIPTHPYANKDGYVLEHRLVFEKKIGRYLGIDEIIHHINHDPSDNRPENLMVLNKIEHNIIHGKGKALIEWNRKNKA